MRYSSRDGHAEGEHVNRGRDTPGFCPTLQVLDMSTLGDVADVNPVIKFLPHTLHCVQYSSRDGHAEGEHVNRGGDTPSFCPTLQVPRTCNVCGRNFITGMTSAGSAQYRRQI